MRFDLRSVVKPGGQRIGLLLSIAGTVVFAAIAVTLVLGYGIAHSGYGGWGPIQTTGVVGFLALSGVVSLLLRFFRPPPDSIEVGETGLELFRGGRSLLRLEWDDPHFLLWAWKEDQPYSRGVAWSREWTGQRGAMRFPLTDAAVEAIMDAARTWHLRIVEDVQLRGGVSGVRIERSR